MSFGNIQTMLSRITVSQLGNLSGEVRSCRLGTNLKCGRTAIAATGPTAPEARVSAALPELAFTTKYHRDRNTKLLLSFVLSLHSE